MKTIIQTILPIVEPIFSVLIRILGTALVNALDSVLTALTVVSELMTGDFQGAFEAAAGYLGRWKSRMVSLFSGLATTIKGALVNGAIDAISLVVSIYQSGFNKIANFISGIWNGIRGDMIGAFNDIIGTVVSGINGLIGTIRDAADEAGIDTGLSDISAPSLDQEALSLNTERTTNVGDLQSQNEETIRVVLDEKTDVVEGRIAQTSERVLEDRERRTQRNSGRNPNPR